jgi:alanyl-tRNA synthetase
VDLVPIYGAFREYKSFRPIMELEFERWQFTDGAQTEKLQKLVKKKKGVFTVDDW